MEEAVLCKSKIMCRCLYLGLVGFFLSLLTHKKVLFLIFSRIILNIFKKTQQRQLSLCECIFFPSLSCVFLKKKTKKDSLFLKIYFQQAKHCLFSCLGHNGCVVQRNTCGRTSLSAPSQQRSSASLVNSSERSMPSGAICSTEILPNFPPCFCCIVGSNSFIISNCESQHILFHMSGTALGRVMFVCSSVRL